MMSAVAGAVLAVALNLPKPHATATLTTSPPILDGTLDDTVWELAVATDGFTQKSPTDGVAPSERTTVRVLYDREYLYIGIECEQRRSHIVGRMSRRDREVESDRVVVALCPRQPLRHRGDRASHGSADDRRCRGETGRFGHVFCPDLAGGGRARGRLFSCGGRLG